MSTHIVLTELYYAPIHGEVHLEGQYLVLGKFNPFTYDLLPARGTENEEYEEYDDDEYYDDNDSTSIESISHFYRENYKALMLNSSLPCHTIIRNYKTIVLSEQYFTPQIAQCIVLPTQETIAIIKTLWFKIIQRTWKKIFHNRKKILNHNILTNNFYLRGNNMSTLPSIHGMLYNLYCKRRTNTAK